MISIIICSHKKKVLETLAANIELTIGIAYEIIVIENPEGVFGICEAYNRGAEKASFDIFCFMHEDTFFETPEWGKKVVQHLAAKTTGLIGLAGGDTKSMIPGSWPSYITENEISLIQHFKDNQKSPEKIIQTGADLPGQPAEVACIDGVWMCTRRDVFTQYQFDENFFKGFHGYDIDFSLQVNQTWHVFVVFDILLHHYSEGSFNREWLTENTRLSKKWKKRLPFSVKNVSKAALIRQHWTCMHIYIDQMISLKCSTGFMLSNFFYFSFNRYFHWRHFLYSCKIILLKKFFVKSTRQRSAGNSRLPIASSSNQTL
jgi:glycosyltransferase involved in cell wall biosynthesis